MINFLFKKVYKKVSELPLVRYCAYVLILFPIIAQKKITRIFVQIQISVKKM